MINSKAAPGVFSVGKTLDGDIRLPGKEIAKLDDDKTQE